MFQAQLLCLLNMLKQPKADKDKMLLLEGEWENSNSYTFVTKVIAGTKRRFNPRWLASAKWLRYSLSTDTVYCAYCHIFGSGSRSPCMQTGDWSNISKLIEKHESSTQSGHHSAIARGTSFMDIQAGQGVNIREQLNQQIGEQVVRNRSIIKSIAEILLLLARQNIAIRGHSAEESNFQATLKYASQYNDAIRDYLANARYNAKYTSPEIQNELLELCASQILSSIVRDCNNAVCFTFIADESTDVGILEQISMCVRFVHKQDGGEHQLREEFLCFVHADTGTKADALSAKFLDTLDSLGIQGDKMRGQGYDGAAVMSGHVSGVQTRIRAVHPHAQYVHCRPHLLNLCIVHSSQVRIIRNVMDTMEEVSASFKRSAK